MYHVLPSYPVIYLQKLNGVCPSHTLLTQCAFNINQSIKMNLYTIRVEVLHNVSSLQ